MCWDESHLKFLCFLGYHDILANGVTEEKSRVTPWPCFYATPPCCSGETLPKALQRHEWPLETPLQQIQHLVQFERVCSAANQPSEQILQRGFLLASEIRYAFGLHYPTSAHRGLALGHCSQQLWQCFSYTTAISQTGREDKQNHLKHADRYQ